MNKSDEFSITRGTTLTFNVDDNKIRLWFSGLTGLEKIYINGILLTSQRTISQNSVNQFKVGENVYSIHLRAVSMFNGPIECTLTKNGKQLKRKTIVFPKHNRIFRYLTLTIIGIMIGGGIGTVCRLLEYSDVVYYLALFVSIVGVSIIVINNRKIIIEEEDNS